MFSQQSYAAYGAWIVGIGVICLVGFCLIARKKPKNLRNWVIIILISAFVVMLVGKSMDAKTDLQTFSWKVIVDASDLPFDGRNQIFVQDLSIQIELADPDIKGPFSSGGFSVDYGKTQVQEIRGYRLKECKAVVRHINLVDTATGPVSTTDDPVIIEHKFDITPGPMVIKLKFKKDGSKLWEVEPK